MAPTARSPRSTYQASNYFVDVVFSNTAPGDTVAPTVTNFTPFEGTANVPVNPTVTIYFSEALDTSTVNSTHGQVARRRQQRRAGDVGLRRRDPHGHAHSDLGAGQRDELHDLHAGRIGRHPRSGRQSDGPEHRRRRSRPPSAACKTTRAPTITAFSPANGATSVGINSALTVTFSEPLNAATVKSTTVYLLKDGTTLVPTTLTYNAATRTATLTPTAAVAEFHFVHDLRAGRVHRRQGSGRTTPWRRTSRRCFQTVEATGSGSDTTAPTITNWHPPTARPMSPSMPR